MGSRGDRREGGSKRSIAKRAQPVQDRVDTVCNPAYYRALEFEGTPKLVGLDLFLAGIRINYLWHDSQADRAARINGYPAASLDIQTCAASSATPLQKMMGKVLQGMQSQYDSSSRRYQCTANLLETVDGSSPYGQWMRKQPWAAGYDFSQHADGVLERAVVLELVVGTPTKAEAALLMQKVPLQIVPGLTQIIRFGTDRTFQEDATDFQINRIVEVVTALHQRLLASVDSPTAVHETPAMLAQHLAAVERNEQICIQQLAIAANSTQHAYAARDEAEGRYRPLSAGHEAQSSKREAAAKQAEARLKEHRVRLRTARAELPPTAAPTADMEPLRGLYDEERHLERAVLEANRGKLDCETEYRGFRRTRDPELQIVMRKVAEAQAAESVLATAADRLFFERERLIALQQRSNPQ